jgi:molybdenum cofactor synthesis domain-containing protein
MVLCHDITQIIPGKYKGAAFKRGHIIEKEDIPRLLDMGKNHIYVWDLLDGWVHEDEAAIRIARAVAGNGVMLSVPAEGKVELSAAHDGLLKINQEELRAVNRCDGIVIATRYNNQPISRGNIIAGTRIIPLVIEKNRLEALEDQCHKDSTPIITVKPFKPLSVGIITTGSELYHKRIADAFGPVLKKKVHDRGSFVVEQLFASDSVEMIIESIQVLMSKNVDLILTTGGMSVDPDDVTPEAIRRSGAKVITYGAPVLPGAMFMIAYLNNIPILGLPGCVMYSTTSIFDLIFPRILAGETIHKNEIIDLGYGGLCLNCKSCRFPDCGFGKTSI